MISGSFAEMDLQLEASYGSSPLCAHHDRSHIRRGTTLIGILVSFPLSLRQPVDDWHARAHYGLPIIIRLLKIIGLSCRIFSLYYGSLAKETYNFKEPTNRSHAKAFLIENSNLNSTMAE